VCFQADLQALSNKDWFVDFVGVVMQFLQSDKDKAEGRYSSVSGQKVCSSVVLIALHCMWSCIGFMLN